MQVIKRDGNKEDFDFKKIEKVIRFAIDGEDDRVEFSRDLNLNLKDDMTTRDIHKVLTQQAIDKVGAHTTRWDAHASKFYLYNLIKEAGLNRGYSGFKYGNLYDLICKLTSDGLYHESILKSYTKDEIDELGDYIDPERDFLFTYAGVKTFTERYLVKGHSKEVLELPQEAYMGIAMFLATLEMKQYRVFYAKLFYDLLSQHEITVATPTMSNARKPFNQLSSCFIGTVQDSLESIYNLLDLFAQVSKFGGGFGLYIGKVRATNSDIRGFKNTSNGVIPWIKSFNSTAVSCNQLGQRPGSISITLDVHHRDIMAFLHLKSNVGDERMKAHDIFPAVAFSDVFMRQVKANGKFYLFCPHEIKTIMGFCLEDYYGDEFEQKYQECVNHPDLPKTEMWARDIMKEFIKSVSESGTPFASFRDSINRMNPNKHAGMIYSSNLCHEINQNMSPNGELQSKTIFDEEGNEIIVHERKAGDFVVCNLASLNLGKVWREEDLARVIPLTIRMMDNVIDLNYYPVQEAKITNKKYRSLGLGVSGYHHMLVQNEIDWDSQEHVDFANKVFENINYHAIKSSMEIAKEKGVYSLFEGSDWHTGEYFTARNYTGEKWIQLAEDVSNNGIRNAYLMAVAPTGSTSILVGATASIDPVYSKFFIESGKNNITPMFAPDLSDYFWFYKDAHSVSQTWSVKANNARQRHIDQSQSFNLYITPQMNATEILKLYMLAWSGGTKTIYYVRSRSIELDDDCLSCSA